MEKIAVFVNDADYAQHLLQPMLRGGGPTHWVLVGCAPVLTRHIGRWVSQAARRQWRERWAAELFAALEPGFSAQPGSQVETLLAGRPLIHVTAKSRPGSTTCVCSMRAGRASAQSTSRSRWRSPAPPGPTPARSPPPRA